MAATTKPAADIAYLCRARKAPSLAQTVERLAERARADSWTLKSSSPPASNEKSPHDSRTAGSHGPRRPIPGPQDPRGVRLRPRPLPQTRRRRPSPTPSTSSTAATTSCSSARPPPVKTTSPLACRSGPAKPGTESCSPPPLNGSTGSPPPAPPGNCTTNSAASAATRCSAGSRGGERHAAVDGRAQHPAPVTLRVTGCDVHGPPVIQMTRSPTD